MKLLNNNYNLIKCNVDDKNVDILVDNSEYRYILRSFNESDISIHLFVEDKSDSSMVLISFEIERNSFNSILGYIENGGKNEVKSVVNGFLDIGKENSSLITKLVYKEEIVKWVC